MSKLREARIDGEFRRALGELLLTELKDPRLSRMASVSKVSVTQDLKYAKVYVSVYDTPEKIKSTMEALESAEPFLRARLNEMIRLRRIPAAGSRCAGPRNSTSSAMIPSNTARKSPS